jgi:hypothetical protein
VSVPERIEDLRVAMVGYRDHDGGPRQTRVDVIDARNRTTLLSVNPADARVLARWLVEVAGWAGPGHDPGS